MLLFALLLVEFDVLPVSYDVLPTEYAVLDTQATVLPGETVTDATPEPRMAPLIQQRKAAYRAVMSEVERTGKPAVYESRGPANEGWMLPKGRYRIERDADGDAAYELIEPAAKQPSYLTPIPKPDAATGKRSLQVEECLT